MIDERKSRALVRDKVTRLLLDYAGGHFPRGGAGQYGTGSTPGSGPGGLLMAGADFDPDDRPGLRKSYEDLGHALTLLAYEDGAARDVLNRPYLTDPADASLVGIMRERAARARLLMAGKKKGPRPNGYTPGPTPRQREAVAWVETHDRAVHLLAYYLDGVNLYVRWPSRSLDASALAAQDRMDRFYDLMCEYRGEMRRGKAIETAAAVVGYDRSRGYQIADAREKPVRVELA